MENQEKDKASLFSQLVAMFSTSAMHHLGKLVDPGSGKAEVNLDGARMSIDLLTMLQEKTAGNLTEDEDRMLKEVLTVLRLNYVETANQSPPPASSAPAQDDKPKREKAESAAGKEEKEPRFHKSYS
ncbi:MAG TPA: DUF1844 domain-containing protein [Kiritimatiellia bacterium]|nr:DUF1844 domain-containing protein [Kiritimatiellia bacterium]HNS80466.1 DUF1844 domain-containing protein [Kiritimatiellia bacterium]HPA77291.1 DUF1844 domain-containing protein [Kiritimatiellia bacterium]HQQ03221.1 DUF1844 domain-containing protein [Kiritimatiellia bacterium]